MNGVSFNSKSVLGDKLAIQQLDESKQDKLTFDSTPTIGSSNPVTSGGVASAISEIEIPEIKFTNKIWTPTHWKAEEDGEVYSFDEYMYADCIWTDGDNIYHSGSRAGSFVLNKSTSTWSEKEWNGYPPDFGYNVWTDGENYYALAYDYDSEDGEAFHVVLDKTTSTWSRKTWYGLSETTTDSDRPDVVDGSNVWTDGEDIYYLSPYSQNQYVLDKSTSTWNIIGNYGNMYINSRSIWTDGDNTYNSSGAQITSSDRNTLKLKRRLLLLMFLWLTWDLILLYLAVLRTMVKVTIVKVTMEISGLCIRTKENI